MKLLDIFNESIKLADNLLTLYNTILAKRKRSAKKSWIDKLYSNRIISWRKKDGAWRSFGKDILIIGKKTDSNSQNIFKQEYLCVLLRTSLVMAMSAVDKILHEAVSKNFVALAKDGKLDKNKIISFPVLDAYRIAIESRKRSGKDGKTKIRPGHKIKEVVIREIFKSTFLPTNDLERICSLFDKGNIFSLYKTNRALTKGAKELKIKWSVIYKHRNNIAHECDIVRKQKARKIHFNNLKPNNIINEINFVKDFGNFIARELE
jgi:hypothetical protein